MKSSEQIAEEWGLSKITINDLCNKGKIPGAVKEGRKWLIPDDAARPIDGRVSSGKYAKRNNAKIKPLPIGKDLVPPSFFLEYFPEDTRPSTGFSALSGICHCLPTFIAPKILPLLHKSLIVLLDIPHSIAT